MSELTLQQQYDLLQEKYKALEKKHAILVTKAATMRNYQKQYFTYRASSDLKASKRMEHEVDVLLNNENKVAQSKQKDLFDI